MYNPPRSAKELGMMKISYGDSLFWAYYEYVQIRYSCKCHLRKINNLQLKLFKDNIFRHFIDC